MSQAFREWWQREAAGKGNDKALRNRKGMERAFNAGLLAAAEMIDNELTQVDPAFWSNRIRQAAESKEDDKYYTKDWKDQMIQDQGLEECAGDIEDEIRQAAED